jgi:hypothetical protein
MTTEQSKFVKDTWRMLMQHPHDITASPVTPHHVKSVMRVSATVLDSEVAILLAVRHARMWARLLPQCNKHPMSEEARLRAAVTGSPTQGQHFQDVLRTHTGR